MICRKRFYILVQQALLDFRVFAFVKVTLWRN